jgi:ABC-type glycerol-3-phosphate transport system permease component
MAGVATTAGTARRATVGRRRGRVLSTALTHLFGILVVLLCLSPVLFLLNASFRNVATYQDFGFALSGWTLSNYLDLFETTSMGRWIANTLFVSAAITVLTVIVDLMAAFAFAKLKFRGRNALFLILISTMMLPFSITLVPTYLLAVRYGLTDSYQGLILPALSGPIGVYLLRQFILTIPDALLEAARIDGASSLRIFLAIVAPLSLQPMAVLAVFSFVNSWNSFLWPLLIAQSDEMKTLTVGIATTHLQYSDNLGGITAGVMISLIPMVVLFFLFQRFYLQGITVGAIKG